MIKPLISICVPVFNGELFLRQCLDTCFSQDYTDFEVLVCDDGSGDESVGLIKEYQSKYPQLRFYQNEKNLGLVGNWNRCVELAKGEWIKFVFQDDYIRNTCLSEFVKRIKPDTQLIVSKRHFVLPADVSEEVKHYYLHVVRTLENSIGKKQSYSAREISQAATQYIGMNFITEPSLSMFKKSALADLGWFNPLLKQICDLEFMLRLASHYGLEYIDKDLCFFRIHGASTTNSNVSSKYFELKFIEPVLLAWLLLYANAFESFRSHLSVFQRIKLKLYFKLKTHLAALENKRLDVRHSVFETQNTEFLHIQKAVSKNWLISLLARLLKNKA